MAIVGLDIDGTEDFSFPDDKADPTVFKIGTLSSRVLGILNDASAAFIADAEDISNMKAEFKGNQNAFLICQFGLKGWTNFTAGGKPVPFELIDKTLPGTSLTLPAVPDALLELLPLDRIQELSRQVGKANTVSEEEGKPSGT